VSQVGSPGEARGDGLDDVTETERPWSLVDRDGPVTEGSPRVTVHYVVVDGEDGEALRERQARAIRALVKWAYTRSTNARGRD
jgi:hypothetical protein